MLGGKGIKPFTFVEALCAIGTALIGVLLFWWTYLGFIEFGGDISTIWGRRVLIFIGVALMSGGSFFVMNTWRKRIIVFIVSFISIGAVMFIMGGGIGYMDAQRTGEPMSTDSVWLAFDANYELGVTFVLIADAMSTLLPWVFFALVIYQVLYSGEADEQLKAVMEGGTVMGFMWVFAVFIYPNFV